jgi:anti-sigma factor RsiW
MTSSRYPQVTDELLSAYLDQAVTAEEQSLIEEALAADPAIVWRLEALRQTVQLLRALPTVVLPRTFTLSEKQIAEYGGVAAPTQTQQVTTAPARAALDKTVTEGFFREWGAGWRRFWQVGSPLLRNAAAVSLALFLVLISGSFLFPPRVVMPGDLVYAPVEIAAEDSPGDTTGPQEAAPAAEITLAPTATMPPQPGQPATAAVESSSAAADNAAAKAAPASDAVAITAAAAERQPAAESSAITGQPGPDSGVDLAPTGPDPLAYAVESAVDEQVESAAAEPAAMTQTAAMTERVSSTVNLSAQPPITDTLAVTVSVLISEPVSTMTGSADLTDVVLVLSLPATENPSSDEPQPTSQSLVVAQPEETPLFFSPLVISQLVTALLTVILGALWWRSRAPQPKA